VPSIDSAKDDKARLYDLNYLKTISDDNREFIREMVETFIQSIPKLLNEMDEALHVGEWSKVSRIAHQMKPSLTLLGIHRLKESAIKIEEISETPDSDSAKRQVKKFIQACSDAIAQLTEEVESL
jgi:HPt (histidine-containing phosphotransfer) domain-containing protein